MIPLGNFPQEIVEPAFLRHRITFAQIGGLLVIASGVVMLGAIGLVVWMVAR